MNREIVIKFTALTELIIGLTTLTSLLVISVLPSPLKPFNVFIFVLISSISSSIIGLGLFAYREWARKTILLFSAYILLTKVLIFLKLLHFEGEIISFIPTSLKDIISFLYHSWILLFFSRKSVKNIFI